MGSFQNSDIFEKPQNDFWSINNAKLSLKTFTTGLFTLQWSEVSRILNPVFLETVVSDTRLFLKKLLKYIAQIEQTQYILSPDMPLWLWNQFSQIVHSGNFLV